MIADHLLDRLQSLLRFETTRWSLVRIALVAVIALAVASQLIPHRADDLADAPYNNSRGSDRSQVVSLPLGDTRGFAPSKPNGTFRVSWVGGSEILGVKPGNRAIIPGLVNDRIDSVDGRRPTTDIYFLNAIRLVDELAALKKALASKPDALVVSLNPVWVLNDLAVQQWDYLDGIIAGRSVWPPSSWPVAASLVSPGDAGWRALSAGSRPIDERLTWGTELSDKTSKLSFLDPVPGAKEPPLTELGKLAQRRPVDFWQANYDPLKPGASLSETQLAVLERGLASRSSFNGEVLKEMFASARRSGVDTYFYVPAISPAIYNTAEGRRDIAELRQRLAEVTQGETSSRVHFDPQGLQDRVGPMRYEDIIHKFNPGAEVDVLTQDICTMLQRQGHRTDCEAS